MAFFCTMDVSMVRLGIRHMLWKLRVNLIQRRSFLLMSENILISEKQKPKDVCIISVILLAILAISSMFLGRTGVILDPHAIYLCE